MNKGFTLVELMVSVGILAAIFAISTIALSTILPSTSQNTAYDSLVSDLRLQQTQAMTTDSYYGIHFQANSYTLFKGSTYSVSDTSNYVVNLDPTVTFSSIKFPGSQVVFIPGSGDVNGYTSGSDSVSMTNLENGKVTTVRINKYGTTY